MHEEQQKRMRELQEMTEDLQMEDRYESTQELLEAAQAYETHKRTGQADAGDDVFLRRLKALLRTGDAEDWELFKSAVGDDAYYEDTREANELERRAELGGMEKAREDFWGKRKRAARGALEQRRRHSLRVQEERIDRVSAVGSRLDDPLLEGTEENYDAIWTSCRDTVARCRHFLADTDGLKGWELERREVEARMAQAQARLSGLEKCPDEAILSGEWLRIVRGESFASPHERMFDPNELPVMGSPQFESLYQDELRKQNNSPSYTKNRHFVRAMEFQYKFVVRLIGDILSEDASMPQEAEHRYGRNPIYERMVDRVAAGRALPDDLVHMERLLSALRLTQELLRRYDVFRQTDSVAEESRRTVKVGKDEKKSPLLEDMNYFEGTSVGSSFPHLWNFLAGKLGGVPPVAIGSGSEEEKALSMRTIRTGALCDRLREVMEHSPAHAQRRELLRTDTPQREQADRLHGGGPMGGEEARLRLEDLELGTQTCRQARLVARDVETETERRLRALKYTGQDSIPIPGTEKTRSVQSVITDYTQSSAMIRKAILGKLEDKMAVTQLGNTVKMLDETLRRLGGAGRDEDAPPPVQTSYRYAVYGEIPNPYGVTIHPGDIVSDPGFISTSANKRFIQKDEVKDKHVPSCVNLSITGVSGVPIAMENGTYSNKVKKANNEAGQGEILYPRNVFFRVAAIKVTGSGPNAVASAVLEEVSRESLRTDQPVKDIYTGAPLTPDTHAD